MARRNNRHGKLDWNFHSEVGRVYVTVWLKIKTEIPG